jgi:hypothetical protein
MPGATEEDAQHEPHILVVFFEEQVAHGVADVRAVRADERGVE